MKNRLFEQRPPAPLVRPISQVILTARGDDLDEKIKSARDFILQWMEEKAGRLPPEAWQGRDFELSEVGFQPAKAVSLERTSYWTARLDDADRTVAKRSWTTETTLAKKPEGDELLFGTRVSCVTMGEDKHSWPSVPKFVRQVGEKIGGELDGRQIGNKPWFIDDDVEVKKLVSFLRDPRRKTNVYVLSLPDNSKNADETIIPAGHLFHKTYGIGHVAVITDRATYSLSDAVGKEFSVYRQAVRTYRPGLDFEESEPFQHPYALPNRVHGWVGGSEQFAYFLINNAIRHTLDLRNMEHDLPSYTDVEALHFEETQEKQSKEIISIEEQLNLKNKEISRIKEKYKKDGEEGNNIINYYVQDKNQALEQIDEYKSENYSLKIRIEHLESFLKRAPEEDLIDIPDNFHDLSDWSNKHLAGKVKLVNKAFRAAKKSPFSDTETVYRALIFLRDFYVPMRRGTVSRNDYEKELNKMNLEETACFFGHGAHSQGDNYFVRFDGRKCLLDRHLKGKDSRDPHFGFRLYFFYDDNTQQAIVGSLPNHLPTSIS